MKPFKRKFEKTWTDLLPELLVLVKSSNNAEAWRGQKELSQMATRADAFDKMAREKSSKPITEKLGWLKEKRS